MGKNRNRESLIREVVNIVVHKILAKHTNRPESVHFLGSEIIEYKNKAEKISETSNWNAEDKEYIEKEALELIKEKLSTKYSDVKYSREEAKNILSEIIKEIT
ncbi:MAG: hypothetical protein ABIH28_02175 [archaeon]